MFELEVIMFAVIKTGGKQYRVMPGDVFTVERLAGQNGDTIDFNDVLVISNGEKTHIGTPLVSGASVKARIINQERGDKIIVFKKKRRHNYRRKQGHRQNLTALQITEITAAGISGKAEKLLSPKPIAGDGVPVVTSTAPAKAPAVAKKATPKTLKAEGTAAPKKGAVKKTDTPEKPDVKKAPAAKKPAAKTTTKK